MDQVLRIQAFLQLSETLDRAVASNPELAPARQAILQPLRTLAAFSEEATGALQCQQGALERLRLMLQLSAGWALEIKRTFETGSSPTSDVPPEPEEPPCEGGVLRLGGLVAVALAAGRVGYRLTPKFGAEMVDVVHGVALAASPAETLSRSLQHGLKLGQVTAALESLAARGAQLRTAVMVPMLLDGCERARWQCLGYLFSIVREQVAHDWEGADSALITQVRRASGADKPGLIVELDRDAPGAKKVLHGLDNKTTKVVLASDEGSVLAEVKDVDEGKGRVTVALPAEARAGWVGIITRERREAAVEVRRRVRERWLEEEKGICLRGSDLSLTAVLDPHRPEPVWAPPPSATAAWGTRILDVTVARGAGGAEVVASLARATKTTRVRVRLDGDPTPVELALRGSEARGRLPAALAATEVNGIAEAFERDRDAPDDARRFWAAAPAHASVTSAGLGGAGHGFGGATPSSGASSSDGGGDGSGGVVAGLWASPPSSGAVAIFTGATGAKTPTVVVLRPAFITDKGIARVSSSRLAELDRELSGVIALEELPFVRDDDLVVEGTLGDPRGPAGSALAERAAALAARSSGLDDATLLVLIPEAAVSEPALFLALRADAAQALVIATPAATPAALRGAVTAPVRPSAPMLRVVGRIQRDEIVVTEPLRIEERASGAGAPFLTPFLAVALDGGGAELSVVRIRTVNATRAGVFAALVPVSDKVEALELRYHPETLAIELRAQPELVIAELAPIEGTFFRTAAVTASTTTSAQAPLAIGPPRPRRPLPILSKPPGAPQVQILDLAVDHVRWAAGHSNGVRPLVEIEVARRRADGVPLWTRLHGAAALTGSDDAPLGFDRPIAAGGIDQVRVVVGDGWTSSAAPKELKVLPRGLRMRAVSDGRFWLEVAQPSADTVTWRVWEPSVYAARAGATTTRTTTIASTLALVRTFSPIEEVKLPLTALFEPQDQNVDTVLEAEWQGDADALPLPPTR